MFAFALAPLAAVAVMLVIGVIVLAVIMRR